jgi:hypothetical protein
LYIFVLRAVKITTFGSKMVIFPARSANTVAYIQNLRTSQGYIFLILQHFATKRCNFTHSKTLFLAMHGNGFCSSCLDQNFVYSLNHPLQTILKD